MLDEAAAAGPTTLDRNPGQPIPAYWSDHWIHRTHGGWDGHEYMGYIHGAIERRGTSEELRSLMLDYPARRAKGLRPALCIASCCAFGGRREDALPTAAAHGGRS